MATKKTELDLEDESPPDCQNAPLGLNVLKTEGKLFQLNKN